MAKDEEHRKRLYVMIVTITNLKGNFNDWNTYNTNGSYILA